MSSASGLWQVSALVRVASPMGHEALSQCWADGGSASTTLGQHQPSIGSTSRVWLEKMCSRHHVAHQLKPSKHKTLNRCWFNVGHVASACHTGARRATDRSHWYPGFHRNQVFLPRPFVRSVFCGEPLWPRRIVFDLLSPWFEFRSLQCLEVAFYKILQCLEVAFLKVSSFIWANVCLIWSNSAVLICRGWFICIWILLSW